MLGLSRPVTSAPLTAADGTSSHAFAATPLYRIATH
jgi:hypothetical protein